MTHEDESILRDCIQKVATATPWPRASATPRSVGAIATSATSARPCTIRSTCADASQQPARLFRCRGARDMHNEPVDPRALDIQQAVRAQPLPEHAAVGGAAIAAAASGLAALGGGEGPARDGLVYAAAIALSGCGGSAHRTRRQQRPAASRRGVERRGERGRCIPGAEALESAPSPARASDRGRGARHVDASVPSENRHPFMPALTPDPVRHCPAKQACR